MLNSPPISSTPCEGISESNVNTKKSRSQASNLECNTFQPITLPRPPETTTTITATQSAGYQKHEDNIINLINNDSEICQQQKQQRASSIQNTNTRGSVKINNLTLPSRRSSVFADTRYSSAPMSIAQRSMQQPPSLAPLNSEPGLGKTTKKSPEKKNSPAGVINFIQTHGRITGNAPTITTRISKDYNNDTSNSVHIKNQLSGPVATDNVSSVCSTGVPNLPSSVLQQKRRNLKNTLNNISAIRDGQVSLLKSAHQRQNVEDIDIVPLVTTTVVPHLSLYGSEPSVEEALPEHIIIAAPKKKKDELPTSKCPVPSNSQKISKTLAKANHSVPASCDGQLIKTTDNARDAIKVNSPSSMNNTLTDAISLGNVIRDTDLLKLILKALKWPVTVGNCEEQMARLKNSKFAVIMSDSNLLQDTDLTQLLGPYLSPMMPVVQQQQSASKIATSSPANSPPQATSEMHTIGDCTMPFKLPPETSVQLVPSSPTDQEPAHHLSTKSVGATTKRPQRKSRIREFQIDEPKIAPSSASTSNAALVTNELLNINAMLISQFGSNPADAINEALISMLKQQQDSKNQRSTRLSRSAPTNSVNLEDIVLVEPQPSLETSSVPVDDITKFKLPVDRMAEPQPITRPIIKRRKAVLQISEPGSPESRDLNQMPEIIEDSTNNTETKLCNESKKSTNTSNQTQKLKDLGSTDTLDAPQAPTSTVPEDNTNTQSINPKEIPIVNENNTAFKNITIKPTLTVRKTEMKSNLGQKLLEAIGLPQAGKDLPPESSRDTLRSALKRSLKQAQEQQQQLKRVKQEEPVKQLADSTTRSGGGESSEEHKKAIAERELELLKHKTKNSEKAILSLKK